MTLAKRTERICLVITPITDRQKGDVPEERDLCEKINSISNMKYQTYVMIRASSAIDSFFVMCAYTIQLHISLTSGLELKRETAIYINGRLRESIGTRSRLVRDTV